MTRRVRAAAFSDGRVSNASRPPLARSISLGPGNGNAITNDVAVFPVCGFFLFFLSRSPFTADVQRYLSQALEIWFVLRNAIIVSGIFRITSPRSAIITAIIVI